MAEGGDEFLQPGGRRDFALLVEGSKVYVNRDYLASWSPVFEKIFYREGFQPNPDDGMPMKGKKLADFLEFLHCICPAPSLKPIEDARLEMLLVYANEYDVAALRDRCAETMARRVVTKKVVGLRLLDYLHLAGTYNFGEVKKLLVPLVAQLSIDQIKMAHDRVPGPLLAAVYQSAALGAQAKLSATKMQCCKCAKTWDHRFDGAKSECCKACVSLKWPDDNCSFDRYSANLLEKKD